VFLPEEDAPGRGHVVIISNGFWKSHFGGSRDAIGRTLTLDGESHRIVGVMPASFTNASWTATAQPLWVPNAFTAEERAVRDNHNDQVVARLEPGVDLRQAQAEMDAISTRLEAAYPKENAGWGASVIPLRELIVGQIRLPLLMLLGAVGLVLLIACANVGNLLFVRALSRRKEIAIRAALGAGRGRVFQQLLVESMLLAAGGGLAGVFLATYSLRAAATILANQLPRADEIAIDMAACCSSPRPCPSSPASSPGRCRRCARDGPTSTTHSKREDAPTARSAFGRGACSSSARWRSHSFCSPGRD
jgi:hypothetical protein